MKLTAAAVIIFFVTALTAPCEEQNRLVALVGETNAALLLEKGEVSKFIKEDSELTLFPLHPEKVRMVETVRAMKPTIGVEILKFAKSGASGCEGAPCLLRIYNLLRSLSTLKGIEYYSASRKRMRIFYEDAFIVETPEQKKRLADPIDLEIPATSELFCYFKDSSFGEYVCSIEYGKEERTISMKMRNITKIWYLFLPIIDPDNMLSYIIILPTDNGILFYGFSCIKGDDALGIAVNKADSLYNRLEALYNWFSNRFAK